MMFLVVTLCCDYVEHGLLNMIRFVFVMLLLVSSVSLACPQATPTNAPNFCATFRVAAQCHCTSSGLPTRMCKSIQLLYHRMISIFGAVEKACEYQHDTTKENCIDSWNCYLNGGVNAEGNLCSGTGRTCA